MMTSLIVTLKNEELTILKLLRSIVEQSQKPDEIVIVDGGSSDNTVDTIKTFMRNEDIPLKMIVENNANIARGRNIAIKNAKYDLIVGTDGSCRLDENWLKNITDPFNKDEKLEVVFGWNKVIGKSIIGKCLAEFFEYQFKKVTVNELSARSVAFKKSAWEKVGGYPEQLTLTGEDALFFVDLERECKCLISKNAVAKWEHGRETLRKIFKMFYLYGIGEAEAKTNPGRMSLLLALYVFGSLLLAAGFVFYPLLSIVFIIVALPYFLRGVMSAYKKTHSVAVFVVMPIVIFTRDIGMIIGYLNVAIVKLLKKG